MSVEDLSISISSAVLGAFSGFVGFIPSLIGGLIILTIVFGLLKMIQLEKFLARYGITKIEGRDIEWAEILAELARWAIIIVFLVPTLEAWNLSAVNVVLNRLILYIPNVIVAVVLALIGLVFSKLGYRIAYSMSRTLGKDLAHTVGLVAEWSIVVFVGFLVLHQLGVAQELLRILFGGLVAMVAIAGGLAFGLGGQSTARSLLESAWNRFKK